MFATSARLQAEAIPSLWQSTTRVLCNTKMLLVFLRTTGLNEALRITPVYNNNWGVEPQNRDVSITENMTQHNWILLQSAKQWADRNDFKYAWHHDGKIYMRKADGERAHVIQRAEDLTRLAV